jgi:hypothetical protein
VIDKQPHGSAVRVTVPGLAPPLSQGEKAAQEGAAKRAEEEVKKPEVKKPRKKKTEGR